MSLEKEKISFSYPIINITAEGARSWGWWKKAWDRGFVSRMCDPHLHGEPQQWGSLTVFSLQVSPLTIFAVKDRNPSILSFARRGLSKHPAYCPQSKSTHNVKYCMYNFFWFSFFSPPRFCKVTNFCSGVNLPRGYFLPWITITPLRVEVAFLQSYIIVIWDWLTDCQSFLPGTEMLIKASAQWNWGSHVSTSLRSTWTTVLLNLIFVGLSGDAACKKL